MSRKRGKGKRGFKRYWNSGMEEDMDGPANEDFTVDAAPKQQPKGQDKPPPHLKGRAIGLWYRDRNRANSNLTREQRLELKKKRKEEHEREPCIEIVLDSEKELKIRRLVDLIKTPLRVPLPTVIPEREIYKRRRNSVPSAEVSEDEINLLKEEFCKDLALKKDMVSDVKVEEINSLKSDEEVWTEVRKASKTNQSETPAVKREHTEGNTTTTDIETKYKDMEDSAFKTKFLGNITGTMMDNINNALERTSCLSRLSDLDDKFKDELEGKKESFDYQQMQEVRKKLPSWTKREELLKTIEENQVIVISGETGCGKTTQVAQFILDDKIERGYGSTCHIVCTQPRRISAITVAERVAAERAERLGQSVGYCIRLESRMARERGSIMYCTTGVLLRKLESDPALTSVSHLILDEIHERDTISDFAITILKDIIPKRPDLKLILMSATLNAQDFSKYYDNCVMINIPGMTFPVKEYYLEDVLELTRFIPNSRSKFGGCEKPWQKYKMKNSEKRASKEFEGMILPYVRTCEAQRRYSKDVIRHLFTPESEDISLELIVALIRYIHRTEGEGAILVFLPGWDKISTLNRLLREEGFSEHTGFVVIPLHSMLPTVSQKSVFDRPPRGMRKIVIATNIAETSITIDDVVFVIDCGKIKMKNFDVQLNLTTLKEEWVSVANARQRRGRAGRVQKGVCYHLFTKAREHLLPPFPVPEMLRTRLEEVILQAKMLQLGAIKPFLSRVLNPPEPRAIDLSLKLLRDLNALDDDENLTPLGFHLAKLPMDPQTGKMILMGALFSVVDPVFSVAAGLSFKDPFSVPIEREKEFFRKKKELAFGSKSDHLVLAEAVTRWEAENDMGQGWQFAREYFLSSSTLRMLVDMKRQFGQHLNEMSFLSSSNVKDEDSNLNSPNIGLVKAIICAGLYPNVAIVRNVKKQWKTGRVTQKLYTPEDGRVCLHIRSINQDEKEFESRFLVYHLKIKTTEVKLHDSTMVFSLALIFFGHNFELFRELGRVVIELSPKIRFTCADSTALLIKELRQRLDQLLEYKVSHPGVTNWDENSDEGKLLRAISELICHEDEQMFQGDESDEDDDDDFDLDEDFSEDFNRGGRLNFRGKQVNRGMRNPRFPDFGGKPKGKNKRFTDYESYHGERNQRFSDFEYGGSSRGGSSRNNHSAQAGSSGVVPFPRF